MGSLSGWGPIPLYPSDFGAGRNRFRISPKVQKQWGTTLASCPPSLGTALQSLPGSLQRGCPWSHETVLPLHFTAGGTKTQKMAPDSHHTSRAGLSLTMVSRLRAQKAATTPGS